ncbi:MAG: hypothetical protein K0R77_2820 [Chryseobacterium sp.]|jgi:hypothetical protein|uniref:hypothetical protein n=1 Tax=Chryseobacterium sp. TaxID=1871047 RepID=UPI0026254904|nr:hypothetical protein [Chryseobacterium sp.]MDF2553545.1 hypothetical protein [Chryseobacterium sp.]
MKKLFFTVIVSITLLSCTNESAAVNTVESMKTTEMQKFDRAMKSLGDPANRSTEEEKRSGSAELSDRRKKILLPSATELIQSTGVTKDEIQKKTNGDISAILVWAIQINEEKSAQIRNNVKL